MRRNHLHLVVLNDKPKPKSLFDKLIEWLNEPHFFKIGISDFEKREIVQNYLTVKFAEYQMTTGDVDLFPLRAAINETEKLISRGKLDSYYKLAKRKMAV